MFNNSKKAVNMKSLIMIVMLTLFISPIRAEDTLIMNESERCNFCKAPDREPMIESEGSIGINPTEPNKILTIQSSGTIGIGNSLLSAEDFDFESNAYLNANAEYYDHDRLLDTTIEYLATKDIIISPYDSLIIDPYNLIPKNIVLDQSILCEKVKICNVYMFRQDCETKLLCKNLKGENK